MFGVIVTENNQERRNQRNYRSSGSSSNYQENRRQNMGNQSARPDNKPEGRNDNRVDSRSDNRNENRGDGRNDNRPNTRYRQGERISSINVTVIIPLFNEEESLPELSLQLDAELGKITEKYEVIMIDDGSTDRSFEVIKSITERNRRFRGIRFRRNYGKSAALAVGFQEARGGIVVTMDADLQDDPAEVKNLIAKLKEGYDLVSGWKMKRKDPISKTIPSKLFNFVTSKMSGLKLHDFNCGLKAYRRDVVKKIQVYGEMHRYLPALAHWEGFKVTEIPVVHHARRYGKTKFGLSRFMYGFLDLLTIMFTTRYLKRPLHFFGSLGTIFTSVGFIIDLWLAIEWFMGKTSLSNRPLSLFGIALIIVGVQSISIGLIGELLVKNNLEKVNYSIKDRT